MPSIGDEVLFIDGSIGMGVTVYQGTVSTVHSSTVVDIDYGSETAGDVLVITDVSTWPPADEVSVWSEGTGPSDWDDRMTALGVVTDVNVV